MRTLCTLFVCFSLTFSSFAQVGKDCINPLVINALPYSATGLTTNGFGDDYSVPCTTCSATNFMSGNDFVFSFQPLSDMNVSIKLSEITTFAGPGSVGLFLVNGCPTDPLTICIAKAEGPASGFTYPEILNQHVSADTLYYIIVDTWNFAGLNPSTGFNIEVYEAFNLDVETIMIFEPRTGCNLANERFVILFRNLSIDTLFSVPVGYQVDNNPPVYETRNDTALPGHEYFYTFSTYSDLSMPNTTYMIKMFTSLPGDGNVLNDTLYFPVTNNTTITTFPYLQDFESNSLGWTTAWIVPKETETSWQWGTPAKPVINEAASGTKCWVTDTIGSNFPNEHSYVIGPCFDFSSITLPVIDLDIWYYTSTYDIAQIEFSTDHGIAIAIHWTNIDDIGFGQNWYNTPPSVPESGWNGSSGGWLHALHTLDTLGGKPYVIFRVSFKGGINAVNEGFAFDNFRVSESPLSDLSVNQIVSPQNSCGLSGVDSVRIKIINHGMTSQHDFEVKCSIDGGNNYITEVVTDTLDFLESKIYTFSTPFNFSNPGTYPIVATTILLGDQNSANDTANTEVMNYPIISSFPYQEDFETNDGYWYSSGLNNSWQWGIPNDTVLTTAASGTHIWATNLSGYHNLAEESYVTSPCIDLSSITNPKLKMMIWYEETYPTYCQLKISTDGGNIYAPLGSASDPNWYNAGYAWTYSSSGWKQVEHSLLNYAGNQDVRLQFYFYGTIQNTGFAFDSIVICDAPVPDFSENIFLVNLQVQFNNSSYLIDSCLWNFGDSTFSNEVNPVHIYTSSDSVLVTLIVYNICGSDSIKKWVHPCVAPIADFSETTSIVNLQVQFNNSSYLIDSCLWNFGDSTFSNEVNPVHIYTSSDSVLVTLIVYNICGSDSIKKWVHPKTVGIAENDLNNLIKLYPNPVNNELTVDISGESGDFVFELSNIQGEIILQKKKSINKNEKFIIPMNKLSSGLYFVKIRSSKGVINCKLFKL